MQFPEVFQCTSPFGHQMEAAAGEELIREADNLIPPNGNMNELLNVGQVDQVSAALMF